MKIIGISPVEAGLRLAGLPFNEVREVEDEIERRQQRNRSNPRPGPNPIIGGPDVVTYDEKDDPIGVFLIKALREVYGHSGSIVADFKNSGTVLQFSDHSDTLINENSRLTISGVESWCEERGLTLPEPLDTELKFFLETLCTYDSLKDTFDIFWDISDKIDELKSQHETVASSTYKFEENKQSALIPVTQKIQLLTRYQSIIDKTSFPSLGIPETAADLTWNADFDPKLNTLVQRSAESIYNESGRWQVDMYERAIRRVSKELGPKLVISASSVRRRTRSPKKPKPPK